MERRTIVTLVIMLIALIGVSYYTRGLPSITEDVTPVTDRYEIRADDTGKTFSYPLTSRFTIILDSTRYQESDIHCEPNGVVGQVSNIPAVEKPYFAVRFETVTAGTCSITAGDFRVTIISTS